MGCPFYRGFLPLVRQRVAPISRTQTTTTDQQTGPLAGSDRLVLGMHWRASHRSRHHRSPRPRRTVARSWTLCETLRWSPWGSSPWAHNLCWRRTRQLTPSPWQSSTNDLTKPRWSWRVVGTAWSWCRMREGRWRWWRDQGCQRKRSLRAWMGWDKHADILSRAICARIEWDNARLRRLTANNYAHIHVFTKVCHAIVEFYVLSVDLGLSRCRWCRTSHRSARRFFFVNFISPRIRNSKYNVFLLDIAVRLCPDIVNSNCILNSYIFHIAKTDPLRCCLYTPRRLE